MTKTIFIIPGFRHSAKEKQYAWMRKFFADQGFMVRTIDTTWTRSVMSDNVRQFKEYFAKHSTETNYILGFSFGAMVAAISAPELKPEKLILCSLSPYFAEDLPSLKPYWRKSIGHRRFSDFETFNAKRIAGQISSPTTIIYGSAEGKKYPRLKNRCEKAATDIKGAKLVVASDAPHQIDFPSYIDAIKDAWKS